MGLGCLWLAHLPFSAPWRFTWPGLCSACGWCAVAPQGHGLHGTEALRPVDGDGAPLLRRPCHRTTAGIAPIASSAPTAQGAGCRAERVLPGPSSWPTPLELRRVRVPPGGAGLASYRRAARLLFVRRGQRGPGRPSHMGLDWPRAVLCPTAPCAVVMFDAPPPGALPSARARCCRPSADRRCAAALLAVAAVALSRPAVTPPRCCRCLPSFHGLPLRRSAPAALFAPLVFFARPPAADRVCTGIVVESVPYACIALRAAADHARVPLPCLGVSSMPS